MASNTIIDTGPIVALISRRDTHHDWAVEQSKNAPASVVTCEAVLSEAFFLLRHVVGGVEQLFAMIQVGFLTVDFDFFAEHVRIRELMKRYSSSPMAFADACLVRMAEKHPAASIWTLDRDFLHYRKNRRQTLSLIAPF